MDNPVMMSNAEYHADSAISKSDLDLINRSPAYYKYVKENPREQTAAMLFGSLVHKLVLEPNDFKNEYAVAPVADRRTSEGKKKWNEFLANSEGKTVADIKTYTAACLAAESVENHPVASKLLRGGQAENSYFWNENGVKCKCRPDYLRTDLKCVIDLKTTQNASPESFVKSAYDYRYHVQAAWYLRGLRACGADVENFVFIAVEKEPPYQACVFAADEEFIKLGEIDALDNLKTYEEAARNNQWNGYENKIHGLTLPVWALNRFR